ncbi:hypothetical protein MNBD_GAMMA23-56 [hydrothermal vent metagenome]|uniref:TIGR03016 family PEP-CTERM system-associated outer membrane protein n=1 Tax=hydrothermal vent metagenome TaxID=652676 RepID=A0A3B1AWE0_9ZZZZ
MVIQHMEHIESRPDKLYLLAGLLSLNFLLGHVSYAGEVRFTPFVGLKESYSDNILLAPKGQEEGEFVTEISPGFSLQTTGSNFRSTVNYTLQNLYYLKDSNRNQAYNQLSASSNAELVDDYFFFDVNANHTQAIANADEPVANNNIAVTSNRISVTSYNLSPYFRHSFRGIMDATLRYSYSEVDFRRDELVDSTQSGVNLQLTSPQRTTGVSWGVNYSKTKSAFGTGNDFIFGRGSLQLGYRFTTRTNIYATSGKEDNSFAVNNNQNIDQSFWNVGAAWQPSAQDSITVEFGDRFFGKTERFGWRHNSRRLVFSVDYQEELSTSALALLDQQQSGSTTMQNQPINNIGTSITSQVFVRSIGTATLTYAISKTNIVMSYSNERRKFQDTGEISRIQFASASVRVRASSAWAYSLGANWSNRYNSSTALKTSFTNINFSIQRQLTPLLQAVVAFNTSLQKSNNALTDYNENILSIGITKTFN